MKSTTPYNRHFTKLYVAWELMKIKRLQTRWFPQFDAILSVSQEDPRMTARYVNARTNLWLAPNEVDTEYFQPIAPQFKGKARLTLVFGGSMDVTMNQDAIHWFIKTILPLIRQQIPNVQSWIVGKNPELAIQNLARMPWVKVTGSVLDVREYYRQADVFVVPLRSGGGTKLKTLEAMAMGLPVVSTTVGAQGLEVEPGRHLYVANSPEVFAARVIELLQDRNKAATMGAEARRLVEQRYSWTRIVNDVEDKLMDLFQRRRYAKL
jgi:glycosyltransferase involved in cell wall biosynthesis